MLAFTLNENPPIFLEERQLSDKSPRLCGLGIMTPYKICFFSLAEIWIRSSLAFNMKENLYFLEKKIEIMIKVKFKPLR